MGNIVKNLSEIKEKISPHNPRIIAVTKYYDENSIIDAYNAGLRDFAESKAQDAVDKIKKLPKELVISSSWHFIGHLQSNKVRKVVGNFDYIHSVDSVEIAKTISRVAAEKGIVQKILLQVNNAKEESKFGFNTEELEEVFEEIIRLDSINVVGLMCIAPYTFDEGLLKLLFVGIKDLRDYLQKRYKCTLTELSMGMSNDYLEATQSGSTMIRIGQKIFK